MNFTKSVVLMLFCLIATTGSFAQRQPETAHVNLYFPLVIDGGPRSDQFQTAFTIVNAGVVEADVLLLLYASNASAWKLDLGSGSSSSEHRFTIPAGSSRQFTSTIGSQVSAGWAMAYSTAPVQAVATIKEISDGFTFQQMMIQPVLPSLDYVWPADKNSLLSIANVIIDGAIRVEATFLDSNGNVVGEKASFRLGPAEQTLFSVANKFPTVGAKSGSIKVSAVDRPHDVFVATSLAGTEQGIYSALPSGAFTWPISHWERIWMVYRQVTNAAQNVGVITSVPELKIIGGPDVNAFARDGKTVGVTIGLSQLISDSPSELAFALAHEIGHIYQQRNGVKLEFHPNSEVDADIWGALISLSAGFDPYAAAGTLAKLSMATGRAGLSTQFEDKLSGEVHGSFNERLENIFDALVMACNLTDDLKRTCAEYKSIVHPNLPDVAPLFQRDTTRPTGDGSTQAHRQHRPN